MLPQPANAALAAEAPPAIDTKEANWRQRDAAWCAEGAKLPTDLKAQEKPAMKDLMARQGQALSLEGDRYWAELLYKLRARPDPASQAMADFVQRDAEPGARARLIDRALRTDDAFVAALGAQAECTGASPCERVAAHRWQALEPDNIEAWLIDPPHEQADARVWDAYVERLLTKPHGNTHQAELLQRLWDLDGELGPGLRRAARDQHLIEIEAWWIVHGPWKDLFAQCRAAAPDGPRRQRCQGLAHLLWKAQPLSNLRRTLTLALAGAAGLHDGRWMQRAHETEAVRQWQEADGFVNVIEELIAEQRCPVRSPISSRRRDKMLLGEFEVGLRELRANGADLDALAQQFRARRGAGLLDPMPPRKPAS